MLIMTGRFILSGLLTASLASFSATAAPVTKRNPYSFILDNPYGDAVFELGNVSYLANTKHPKASAGCTTPSGPSSSVPVTVIRTNETVITKEKLASIISSYTENDDVFSHDFLHGLYVSSSVKSSMDASAVDYLSSFNSSWLFLDAWVSADVSISKAVLQSSVELPAGPYLATVNEGTVSFATVYRLYEDTYNTFLFGAYDANDGNDNHNPLGVFLPKFWDPMIPSVPFDLPRNLLLTFSQCSVPYLLLGR